MSYEDFYKIFQEHFEAPYPDLFLSRDDLINFIDRNEYFDIIIAGAGIHGALCARLAALHGLKTLLLEKNDYSEQALERVPLSIHSAFLDSESWNVLSIYRNHKKYLRLAQMAPHLVHARRIVYRLPKKSKFLDFKMRTLSALQNFLFNETSTWPYEELAPNDYCISQVSLNEARFILESILAARQEGAACLNHAVVDVVSQRKDASVEVIWHDSISGKRHESQCRVLLNCTGASTPFLGRIKVQSFADELLYRQDLSLYMRGHWDGPEAIIVPDEGDFPLGISPTNGGFVISAEIRKLEKPDDKPEVQPGDVEMLLSEIAKHLPELDVSSSNIQHVTSAARCRLKNKGATSGKWYYSQGMLTLLGGESFDAPDLAFSGIEKVLQKSKEPYEAISLYDRPMPGAWRFEDFKKELFNCTAQHEPNNELLHAALGRYGSLLRLVKDDESCFRDVHGLFLEGELQLAIKLEQACTVEDVIFRRLGLRILPDSKQQILQHINDYLLRA
ncbi:MAG: FAD-dependent oxidoreductase [SAR324 cluster bacterium]|uniref:FAD-dependent oxidoreductase n=1 Tax=SAR324 cluster bacterium TaxID=2024889 RepID=A0A7X9FSW7_9DELT|nr:FAD-dependent oxidoreductase [SAR324 cluster bacterium]